MIPEKTIMRVAAKSDVKKLSAAIAATLADENAVSLSCMGADAVNQAVKAVAFLQRFSSGKIAISPYFESDNHNLCTRILLEIDRI